MLLLQCARKLRSETRVIPSLYCSVVCCEWQLTAVKLKSRSAAFTSSSRTLSFTIHGCKVGTSSFEPASTHSLRDHSLQRQPEPAFMPAAQAGTGHVGALPSPRGLPPPSEPR